MEAFIYVHVDDDSLEAIVNPETLDLIGLQTDKLRQFLANTNVSMKTLIEKGTFTKICKTKMMMMIKGKTKENLKYFENPDGIKLEPMDSDDDEEEGVMTFVNTGYSDTESDDELVESSSDLNETSDNPNYPNCPGHQTAS